MRYITAAASLLLLVAPARAVPDQYFLNLPQNLASEPPPVGRLWRFDVAEDPNVLKRVLSLSEEHDLDLWQIAHSHVDVYAPLSAPALPAALMDIPHSLAANITAPQLSTRHTSADWDISSLENTTYHTEYHPLFEIEAFIKELAELHPDRVKLKNLGHSGMGRDMLSLTISKGQGGNSEANVNGKKRDPKRHPGDDGKLAIVILGAQHAREWVATSTALYLAHALVSKSTEPHSLASLLNTYDFYIIPVPNPDGYDYTWEVDRFWYKTRQRMGSRNKCFGLDMNRNWGYKWKSRPEGAPDGFKPREPVDPCSHWYPGHHPFEAPEVNSIANLVITIPNLVGFIDLRSYGQMLSAPFSYSCNRIPPDAENQLEAALGAAQAMTLAHGTEVTTGRLCDLLYSAPGNVLDWMYKRAGIKYSYVLHLRDTGTYGFTLPPQWIRPVGEETGELIKYLTKFISKKMKGPYVV